MYAASNCVSHASTGLCSKCNVGYYVSNGACVKHSLAHCLETSDGAICTQCDKGYGLNEEGKCEKCTNDQCYLCKTTTTCSTCHPKYGQAIDYNGNVICVDKIDYCRKYEIG